MRIIRTAASERDYTKVPNGIVRNRDLSGLARAILAYLLSHKDGFEVDTKHVEREFPEGRRAIAGALKELETAGYLVRSRARNEGGKWVPVPWTARDTPDGDDPNTSTALPVPVVRCWTAIPEPVVRSDQGVSADGDEVTALTALPETATPSTAMREPVAHQEDQFQEDHLGEDSDERSQDQIFKGGKEDLADVAARLAAEIYPVAIDREHGQRIVDVLFRNGRQNVGNPAAYLRVALQNDRGIRRFLSPNLSTSLSGQARADGFDQLLAEVKSGDGAVRHSAEPARTICAEHPAVLPRPDGTCSACPPPAGTAVCKQHGLMQPCGHCAGSAYGGPYRGPRGGRFDYPQREMPDIDPRTGWPTHMNSASGGPPVWCGRCGLAAGHSEAVLQGNPRFRTDTGRPNGTPCPDCHPDAVGGAS